LRDVERGLTKRGLRDATAAGETLRAAGLVPDRVLCSTAVRTRQTWDQVSAALGTKARKTKVSFESRLYDADAGTLLDAVRESPDDAGTVLLVGHNPALHQLVLDLTGRPDLAFPTSALAVIQLPRGWGAVASGDGELARLWTPPTP
jgi:phosphohistidine phosphatase